MYVNNSFTSSFAKFFFSLVTLTCSNINAVSATSQCTLSLSGYNVESGIITATISSSNANVVQVINPQVQFVSDSSTPITLKGNSVGVSSVTLSSSASGYTVPGAQNVFVLCMYFSFFFFPPYH